MVWPPVKAWTSKLIINGQRHFIAINYGGKLSDRWVILISVLDGNVVVKVPWKKLCDKTNWNSGWHLDYSKSSAKVYDKKMYINNSFIYPSSDSGLSIPITKGIIRPWFNYD